MARSTAISKVKTQLEAARKSASRARKEASEVRGTKGSLSKLPATIGGGAIVGAVESTGYTAFFGAPVDIVIAVGLGVGGAVAGFSPAIDMAGGAAAVAASRYTRQAIAGFKAKKKEDAE